MTICSRVLPEKLTVPLLVKKFPAFCGTRKFITAFTSAGHLSITRARAIRFTPLHPTSLRYFLILFSHLRLGLPSAVLPSSLPSKILYTPLLSSIYATCPAHLIFIDLITQKLLGEEYRLLSSSLCSLLHYPCYLAPQYPQPTFLPECERPSFTPIQNNRQNNCSLYLLLIFLDSKLEYKQFCTV